MGAGAVREVAWPDQRGAGEAGQTGRSRLQRRGWLGIARLVLLGLVLSAVTALVLVFPFLEANRINLRAGDVAADDIHAPRRITYESELRYVQAQNDAVLQVQSHYSLPDPTVARQQVARARTVLDYLHTVRSDPFATPTQRSAWVLAVPELAGLSSSMLERLFALEEESWDRVQLAVQDAVDQAMRAPIRDTTLSQARDNVQTQVSLDLSDDELFVTSRLAAAFLLPNSFYDEAATEAARQAARESVSPVLRSLEAGQIIVREGDIVTDFQMEALDKLGLTHQRIEWTDVAGGLILAVMGTLLLGLYMWRFQPALLWDSSAVALLTLLLLVFLLIARFMVNEQTLLRYIFPAPALAMLAAVALGGHAGVAGAVFLGGVVGYMAGDSLEIWVYATAGGVVAALTAGEMEKIGDLFRAGLFVSLAQIGTVVAFGLSRAPLGTELLVSAGVAAVSAQVSASLALGGLFLIGPLFDVVTTMRLIELSRPDHPLLQRLLREAPGTYHHSLMVANLAEQAAENIGAGALLARVGAYYHDVGKIVRPYFFTENQVKGINPHEQLDPRTSAGVFIGHVKDGMELAQRHHLPSRIRAFIPQHHGAARASFMYQRALEAAGDPSEVNEADFRYPGPRPQSKETALVMLADGCEASARAVRPTSDEEVARVVDRIFESRIAEGQLEESPLTLEDLRIARRTFVTMLKGMYHPRIKYPGQEGEKAEEAPRVERIDEEETDDGRS